MRVPDSSLGLYLSGIIVGQWKISMARLTIPIGPFEDSKWPGGADPAVP